MRKMVRCTCGVEMNEQEEETLILTVQRHALEAHAIELSAEQVRSMMEIEQ